MKPPKLPKIPDIELDGYRFEVNYYVTKEYTDISQAAVELPSAIEWLNWQNQIAIESKMASKSNLERAEALAYFALKGGKFIEKGYGEKVTEDGLKRAVCLDETVIECADNLAVFTALVDRLTNIQRSLQFKLDLVRSSEATRRKLVTEMNSVT
jgi:hypothetical protein